MPDPSTKPLRKPIRLIGLTGSLAAGKTVAAALLKDRGFRVVDADEIAKGLLLEPEVRDRIRSELGGSTYLPDGTPDRKRIASIVFGDEAKRRWLNDLIHPRVRRKVRELAGSDREPLVYDVPLLFESGGNKEMDLTIMIDAPLEERVRRAKERNGWSRDEFFVRESAQMPAEQKRSLADEVIDNDSGLDQLRDRLNRLIETLIREGRITMGNHKPTPEEDP